MTIVSESFLLRMLAQVDKDSALDALRRLSERELYELAALSINLHGAEILKKLLCSVDTAEAASVRNMLSEALRLQTVRKLSMRAQAAQLIRSLNEAGIAPLLLKGVLFDCDPQYGPRDDRTAGDIDLFIAKDSWEQAVQVLAELGYRRNEQHEHHVTFAAAQTMLPVELHFEFTGKHIGFMPAGEVWERAAVKSVDGLRFRSVTPELLVIYSVAHGFMYHPTLVTKTIPLRALIDIAWLLERNPALDWKEVRNYFEARKRGMYLDAALSLLGEFYTYTLPEPHRRVQCAVMRRLISIAELSPHYRRWLIKISAFSRLGLEARFGSDYVDGCGRGAATLLLLQQKLPLLSLRHS